jgi:DNA polymerase-3 subunit delta
LTEIAHTQFDAWLKEHPIPSSGLWLIHGEELMREGALAQLVPALLPGGSSSAGYEPVHDDGAGLGLALEKVRTVSLLDDFKVVVLLDARLFDSAEDLQALLRKIRAAVAANEMTKAARALARLLALTDLDYDQMVDHTLLAETFNLSPDQDHAWLRATAAHAQQIKVPIASMRSGLELVLAALEKPFPAGNHLVLSVDRVDRRRNDYKALAKKAVVVDCSVPQGARAADKKAQKEVFKQCARGLLNKHNKRLSVPAFEALSDKTGFQPRAFVNNLKTLIEFVGGRVEIGVEDVETVLTRTRQDPVYTFTEAIALRHVQRALFYLKSLLSDQFNPLQVLAAMVNQVRKLAVARDFLDDALGKSWRPDLPYPAFRQAVMPDIVDFDHALGELLRGWRQSEEKGTEGKKGKAKQGFKIKSDLFLAPNPTNAYPAYLLLQRAARFTSAELASILSHLHGVDGLLKTSGRNPEAILIGAVIRICKPDAATD